MANSHSAYRVFSDYHACLNVVLLLCTIIKILHAIKIPCAMPQTWNLHNFCYNSFMYAFCVYLFTLLVYSVLNMVKSCSTLQHLPASVCIEKNLVSCLAKNFFIVVQGTSFSFLIISRTQNLKNRNHWQIIKTPILIFFH